MHSRAHSAEMQDKSLMLELQLKVPDLGNWFADLLLLLDVFCFPQSRLVACKRFKTAEPADSTVRLVAEGGKYGRGEVDGSVRMQTECKTSSCCCCCCFHQPPTKLKHSFRGCSKFFLSQQNADLGKPLGL